MTNSEYHYLPYGAAVFAMVPVLVNTFGSYTLRERVFETAEHVLGTIAIFLTWELLWHYAPRRTIGACALAMSLTVYVFFTIIAFDQFNHVPADVLETWREQSKAQNQ